MRGTRTWRIALCCEESQVQPRALDGFVSQAKLVSFGIGKMRSTLEINHKVQGFRIRVEVGGKHLQR